LIANILAMNQRIKHTNKTLYTSPYMVITDQEYTKHYYAGSERIASKLGGGFELASVNPTDDNHDLAPITSYTGIPEFYDQKKAGLMELLSRSWDCVNMQGYASIEGEQLLSIEELQNSNNPENEMFFYHTDHLGSSSWITDASGTPYQHLQSLPFGEQFVDQRNSSWTAPYRFTGKERDSETGFDYFGARYYSSDLSVWLSVDPLASKYPSMSGYMYVAGNPVMLVDPKGLAPERTKVGKFLNKTWNWARGHGYEEGSYSGTYYGQEKLDSETIKNSPDETIVTKKQFIRFKEKTNGQKMSRKDRKVIDDGCIGLVKAELGLTSDQKPSLENSFDNFESAQDYANNLNLNEGQKAVIFAFSFYTKSKTRFKGDEAGRVNMQGVNYHGNTDLEDGRIMFDYSLYDTNTGTWWGANQATPGMVIKIKSLDAVSFGVDVDNKILNRQVFSVTIINTH
jgi:RHS repeat-associated protein